VTTRVESRNDEEPAARTATIDVAGVTLVADLSGALLWEQQSLLVVSDLHLEKGSSFASRGVLLPPYDTVATLGRLASVIVRHDPEIVIALGDSFHDRTAHDRLSGADRDTITALQMRRDWIWISGNHDPRCRPISAASSRAKSPLAPSRFATSRPELPVKSPAIFTPRRGLPRVADRWSGAVLQATASAR
jgi:hypothetical protein